jgi:hypothetical protein
LHKIIETEFELDSFKNSKIIVYKIMIEKHTQLWFEKHSILNKANFEKLTFARMLA